MKIDFIHKIKGFGHYPSEYRICICTENNMTYICFIDLYIGVSVTNASEHLATEIVGKLKLDPLYCRFFETYSYQNQETLDEIKYDWKKVGGDWVAVNPQWSFKTNDDIKKLFFT